jgi:hypothetical protein
VHEVVAGRAPHALLDLCDHDPGAAEGNLVVPHRQAERAEPLLVRRREVKEADVRQGDLPLVPQMLREHRPGRVVQAPLPVRPARQRREVGGAPLDPPLRAVDRVPRLGVADQVGVDDDIADLVAPAVEVRSQEPRV